MDPEPPDPLDELRRRIAAGTLPPDLVAAIAARQAAIAADHPDWPAIECQRRAAWAVLNPDWDPLPDWVPDAAQADPL